LIDVNVKISFTYKKQEFLFMALYDITELEQMAQGNDEFITKMVSVFLETTSQSLDQLLKAFEGRDLQTVSAIAHKIKPSIDLMGITSLHDVVRDIEVRAKNGEELSELVGKLDDDLKLVFKEIKAEL
jgi:HPt (histidine-containing phosphotransfer) domain-containing protein